MKAKISYKNPNNPEEGIFVCIDPDGRGRQSCMKCYELDEDGLDLLKKELDEIRGYKCKDMSRNKEIKFDRFVSENTQKKILDAVYSEKISL